MNLATARNVLNRHGRGSPLIAFVGAAEAARITEANTTVIEDYEQRRDAAQKAIAAGLSPNRAARRFQLPIGFCRNCSAR